MVVEEIPTLLGVLQEEKGGLLHQDVLLLGPAQLQLQDGQPELHNSSTETLKH